jgi:hypothetical protein
VEIRDALTMAPRTGVLDETTPHTRPPADDDAEHILVRTAVCLAGTVEVELVCEPAFDYGRTPAGWTLEGAEAHTADATGAGQTLRLRSDLALGAEGSAVRGRHVLQQGESVFCALSWSVSLEGPADREDRRAGWW